MLVQRVVTPTGSVSWTVVGSDGLPVAPIEGYLAHLAAIERSPNTVRAYAHSLKLFFEFLAAQQQSFDEAGVEDVSRFVAFLRAPVTGVVPLNEAVGARTEATVNRHLAAVFGFYDHQARNGVELAANLADHPDNVTRFLLVEAVPLEQRTAPGSASRNLAGGPESLVLRRGGARASLSRRAQPLSAR